jgi:hypothetical protein
LNILSLPRDRLRLLPQDQDKRFYKDHLLGETYLEPNTPSQERLQDTYDYFKEKLTAIKENDDEVTVEELAERLRY